MAHKQKKSLIHNELKRAKFSSYSDKEYEARIKSRESYVGTSTEKPYDYMPSIHSRDNCNLYGENIRPGCWYKNNKVRVPSANHKHRMKRFKQNF